MRQIYGGGPIRDGGGKIFRQSGGDPDRLLVRTDDMGGGEGAHRLPITGPFADKHQEEPSSEEARSNDARFTNVMQRRLPRFDH